ncbi:carboxylating nicotinate-nucleotide diphosphorylase [Solicola gregarius]|uniref:Nicotinate-nucleotide pyrophosphorylase [carboxylating] n=1 Tax=Solicola gregarius TaxID=2908642 RepID=A0AA46TKJ3_9ACTN|nr:carboxylating nicotinate-nucleotide diphosphorylase [Solicola gregarius]UYM06981.1 carboxylating nicotinate-nucleotide diphosphorylase [Solicola gregarius]
MGNELDVGSLRGWLADVLAEDLDGGVDATSHATVAATAMATGDVVARRDGVVAGLALIEPVVRLAGDADCDVVLRVADGDRVRAGDAVASVTAATRALLTAERTLLNLLCHLGGIATETRRWVDAVAGSGCAVRDTRKTTPLMRRLEKYAVLCGGGVNHRMSLSDEALIKDNHVVAAGGVAAAYRAVRAEYPGLVVQVEVDTYDQAVEAAEAGADLLLLDNMDVTELRRVAAALGDRVTLEASGGLTLDRAALVASTGVDYVAVGALTHSAPVLDLGLDLRTAPEGG